MPKVTREQLEHWTRDFTDAFNANDLERVVSYFSDVGVYDQFNDQPATGRDAIRSAFAPQFSGAFGSMRFDEEDFFVDTEARKTLISWVCSLETPKGRAGWRGLDILVFDDDGKITCKATYAKAKAPLLRPMEGSSNHE